MHKWVGEKRMVLYPGDYYEFTSNAGVITREVIEEFDGQVFYKNAAGKTCRCLRSTFQRWWKGADLVWRKPEFL